MFLTHVLFSLVLALNLGLDPFRVAMGAILPDFDLYLKHRKLFHNIFLLVIASLVSLPIAVGIASHLLLDMLSGGVALFWPISSKRITIARIKTRSLTDIAIGAIFAILAFISLNF